MGEKEGGREGETEKEGGIERKKRERESEGVREGEQ